MALGVVVPEMRLGSVWTRMTLMTKIIRSANYLKDQIRKIG